MPVEECGDMLIMMAAVCKADGNADFARPHWDVLKQWKNYLIEYGADPGDQLCTDDFAGHMEHNVNLSVKAIVGIEAYAMLAEMLGEAEEAEKHHILAKEMAADWEVRAKAGDHYTLAFGSPDTWSLKYNLVWDKMWGSKLFSDEVYEKEIAYYIQKTLEYGTPLDSRDNFTKMSRDMGDNSMPLLVFFLNHCHFIIHSLWITFLLCGNYSKVLSYYFLSVIIK